MTTALGVLILLAVAAGAVYVLFRPQWALVLVLTLHPLKQLVQSYLPAFAVNSPMFNFMIFGVVVLAVLARILRRDGALTGYASRVSVPIWILYGLTLFGALYSPASGNAFDLIKSGAPYWLMMVLLLPLVMVSLDDFRRVAPALMVVGTIICVLIFVNPSASFYTGRLTVNIGQSLGVRDLRGNPLATASMGAQVAMIAVLFRPESRAGLFNLLRVAALVAGLGLAIASGSRGNVVIAAAVAVAFFPLARRVADVRQFFLTAAGFATLAIAMLMTFRIFLSRDAGQQQRWDISMWSAPLEARIVPISSLFNAYASSPVHWLFGLGTNAYSSVLNVKEGYAHNVVAELLCEHGLFGLGLAVLAVFFSVRLGRDLWRMYANDPPRRAAVATLLALCMYMLLLYMKQSTFVVAPDLFAVWIIMAKLATFELRRQRELMAENGMLDEYAIAYGDYEYGHGEPPPEAEPALR